MFTHSVSQHKVELSYVRLADKIHNGDEKKKHSGAHERARAHTHTHTHKHTHTHTHTHTRTHTPPPPPPPPLPPPSPVTTATTTATSQQTNYTHNRAPPPPGICVVNLQLKKQADTKLSKGSRTMEMNTVSLGRKCLTQVSLKRAWSVKKS